MPNFYKSQEIPHRIYFTGLPGAGKSTISQLLATALGYQLIDIDKSVEESAGKSIKSIFLDSGEKTFRDYEKESIASTILKKQIVVSLGGGALENPEVFQMLKDEYVVYLQVSELNALSRIQKQGITRPLLDTLSPLKTLEELSSARKSKYEKVASLQQKTDDLSPHEVTNQILEKFAAETRVSSVKESDLSGGYNIFTAISFFPSVANSLLKLGADTLIICPQVLRQQADQLCSFLCDAGLKSTIFEHLEGERAKDINELSRAWNYLGEIGYGRDCVIVGLGGGATTDFAGFVGATWMRGVKTCLVPTTLLGMVDASVGGKTGINTHHGKNLVGAFHSPSEVFCDLSFLDTLPVQQLRSGMAEIVKCGFIKDTSILSIFDAYRGSLPPRPAFPALISKAIDVKAKIVSADFRESGEREFLNFGHTFGHAVEKCENYTIPHGHAVSLGMVFATRLAVEVGLSSVSLANQVESYLLSLGLPISYRGRWEPLRKAMGRDKKNRHGALRFVLLESLGKVRTVEVNSEQALENTARSMGVNFG
ncbi:3-dehydroquinate synthase [Actinomycetaceae bacterium TAE3-ERU4]|nr:3-dehydroquinate synthase [Actinomycetaceae bacterium TAE3-ERU4]